jgi:hypothetical protein
VFGCGFAALCHGDEKEKRSIVEAGKFEIQAGASAGDIRRTAKMRVTENSG